MSQSRDELQHLIDSLPDDQVDRVLEDVRRLAGVDSSPSADAFAWVGSGTAKNGRTDNATRVDELLAEGFGRN